MSATVYGLSHWESRLTKEGHRDYLARWLVYTSDPGDGPQIVFSASGLPVIGASWAFGNDNDTWARCHPDWRVTPVVSGEANRWWTVEQPFSTRPFDRCQSTGPQDPLDEPPKIGGSFSKFTREATEDRNGVPILSSSHEQIRGAVVERDDNRPTVDIEMNFASIPLTGFAEAVDRVNDATLWGLGTRKVKLSNVSWTRKFVNECDVYFSVSYGFDVNFETFDRRVRDYGTKILAPGGDAANPKDFIPYRSGATDDMTTIPLNGAGLAAESIEDAAVRLVEFYEEYNFLLLGIPTSL